MEKIEKTLFTIAAVEASTMGIGPLWALLAEIGRSGGNSPRFPYIQGEVYKTDTKTLLQFT